MRIDRDDVEAAVVARGAEAWFEQFGITAKLSGGHLRSRWCPKCGEGGSDAFCVNRETLRWDCKRCGLSGGAIDLVAWLAGVDPADFRRALVVVADLAGVAPSLVADPDAAARRAERERQQAAARQAAAEQERADRQASRRRAAAYWDGAWPRDRAGELYLADRGLAGLAGRDDVVRFTTGANVFGAARSANEPCVAVRDVDGVVLSVTARRFPDRIAADARAGRREIKSPTMLGCKTDGTLIGSVASLAPGSTAVLTEGVPDSLAAVLAWPAAVVLGAVGASRVPFVAELAAPIVRRLGGRVVLVPHNDEAGRTASIRAARACIDAGLELGRDLAVVDLGGAKDLNDAWCAGWRP